MSRRHGILGCDRVGQGRENFFRDKGFLGRDRAGHGRACTTGVRATGMCARKRGGDHALGTHMTRPRHVSTMLWACTQKDIGSYMTGTCARQGNSLS